MSEVELLIGIDSLRRLLRIRGSWGRVYVIFCPGCNTNEFSTMPGPFVGKQRLCQSCVLTDENAFNDHDGSIGSCAQCFYVDRLDAERHCRVCRGEVSTYPTTLPTLTCQCCGQSAHSLRDLACLDCWIKAQELEVLPALSGI